MALVIYIIDRHDPSNEMRHQLQPKKTKVRLRSISHLYSSKRHFTHPSLLTRQSTSILKVGVSYESKVVKCVASYSQRRLRGKAILAVYIAEKDVLAVLNY